MSMSPRPRPVDPHGSSPRSLPGYLEEQFRTSYGLTHTPEDQLIIEVVREADNQQSLWIDSREGPWGVRSQISERRAGVLVRAYQMVSDRQKRLSQTSLAGIAVTVLQEVKRALLAQGVSEEQARQIIEETVQRLDQATVLA
jgi:hypothetical protein